MWKLTNSHAIRVQSWMRGRHEGRYHVKHNNCQHFVEELWRRVCIRGYGVDSDSLRHLGTLASRFGAGEGYSSREASLMGGSTTQVAEDFSEKACTLKSIDV